ncbi:class I SAM-dependent methyltransferase [Marivita sp. XM-24bin2]|jgi:ubiquinone/menaquinone biosynthesis C-methylase UbiE|uniref:class I SAM-dependent methyltransferase n=1 Tax=unclassified Marivita TaxID=2632480 RepID=UPI000D78D1F2|nr:class I SAM-dependent methyltransferase [Marivita sp. XM-24bin2]MCR9109766.1 class I SAM-dependent methyltransferase [Paracoccaceae bacterium]PWL36226.1 MAG: ubiquinone biosynthesis protein UbiE [Marivita sp. XM-24bin2]
MYKSAKFWDRAADKYAASPIRNQEAYEATLEQMRTLLSPNDTVLELGCGTGTTAIALAPSLGHITATDVSDAMLDKGREKAEAAGTTNVDFVQSDAADAPAGPFDAVLAMNLLHLLEDLDGALAEIDKRTKPGGLFISKTFCMPAKSSVIWWVIQFALPVMQAIGKAPYFKKLSAADLDAAITRAGFTILETQMAPGKDPRRTVIARKIN